MSAVAPPASGPSADLLRPRSRDAQGPGISLALLAHALLLLGLSVSIDWQSTEPQGLEAELWAAVPEVAAPKLVEPPPPPPAPAPTPAPPPKPAPAPPPRPTPDLAAEREAEIALQRKKEQAQKQAEAEKAARAEKLAEQKARQQAEREEAERKKREAAEKKREDERLKREAAAAEKARQEAAEASQREAQRQENLKRIQGLAGASGGPSSTGTALRDAAPSASYAGRIRARIRPNIVYTEDLPGNPTATVRIEVAPDGRIVGMRLLKSSGVASWDQAALRALEKTEQLPLDTDGTTRSPMELDFRPKDFGLQ